LGADLHIVTFEPSGVRIEVPAGTVVRDAAARAGVPLDSPCGGLGTCGRCAVIVAGPVEPPTADELTLLPAKRLDAGVRLGCRVRVAGDVSVSSLSARQPGGVRVLERATVEPGSVESPVRRGVSGAGPLTGAVVDLGTTTLVVSLVDLRSGEELGSATELNPQIVFGADVMSRISAAADRGVEALRAPVVAAIERLVLSLLGDTGRDVGTMREIAVCGNTTMVHLLLGLDPEPLGSAPYEPAFVSALERPASEVGFARLDGSATVYVLPGVSAFIGSDVIAGLLATRIDERCLPTMFLDLGTNCEIVLRTCDRMIACSAAAGPALEGANISHGMLAEPGAIERVEADGDGLRLTTIGEGAPLGLCGSGLLDLVALLLDTGVLDSTGRLRADAPHALAARVRDEESGCVFEVAPGVLLTQQDVRQVQLAKAAVAAGIEAVLESAGCAAGDVTQLIVAGGFGYHVRPEALVRMGMVPREWAGRMTFAGNTARAGALIALLDGGARRRAEALACHVETLDLAARADFEVRFVGAMDFPAAG
jgi:uncharacterized 2Fe-2S/4Fe-4S cluster protein (DUF4445 family)